MVGTWKGHDDRVRLVSISRGAEFELDLARFPDAEPTFAYVDDYDGSVEVLRGLEVAGTITIPDRPQFMWLEEGPRTCVLLRATAAGMGERRAAFRTLSVGEFCLEIYSVRPDQSVELLHQNDFCFK